jgi:two-component system response regulator VicR
MRKRILIIDDDPDILELLKIVFRDSGHNVVYSLTSLERDYIDVLHPDLILLDVRIQGDSRRGSELCRKLKASQQTSDIPVVLCSAEYNLQDIAMDCHADMFITKPYDFMDLLSQVNKYLS